MATELNGERILWIRRALGLNQSQFSRLIGVNQAAISHWENNRHQPTGSAILLLRNLEKRAEQVSAKKVS